MAIRTLHASSPRRFSSSHRFLKILAPLAAPVLLSFLTHLYEHVNLNAYVSTRNGYYGESFSAPSARGGGRHEHVYKWKELRRDHRPGHGTFFFGPHSGQIGIPKEATFDASEFWDDGQRRHLDDERIDIRREERRCSSYNFQYANRTKRRRLFLGALLADEPFEVLRAVSTEIYNVFHTVSFVESNVTHSSTPRRMRFYDPEKASDNLFRLYQMYGPDTKVSVDYYSSHMMGGHDLLREFIQREGNNVRWAMNGMRPDDVGIVSDADETFTRDFLRALQICDLPQFRQGQTCHAPGIGASTYVFESTPECLTKDKRWYHPDAMLGECIDQIGDVALHPRGKREWPPEHMLQNHTIYHGYRLKGHGGSGDYSQYHAEHKFDDNHVPYPLYYATDQRMEGGTQIQMNDGSPTGYHFHNFFEDRMEIHYKYFTYGHAWGEADKKPIWELHEDIALGRDCLQGKYDKGMPFSQINPNVMPIYYMNETNRIKRHEKWRGVIESETLQLANSHSPAKSIPTFQLGQNQTLCKLVELQVVCTNAPRNESVAAYPMFANYYIDGDGQKVSKQSALPSRPISTNWFRPDPNKYCLGNTNAPCANLGDELRPMLLLLLSGNDFVEDRYDGMDVVIIGSVLNFMVKNYDATVKRVRSYHNVTVWGTGTKWKTNGVCFDFRAVRGPKTRDTFLEQGCYVPEVYGDPALLFPYLYAPRKSFLPDADLCIVPHMDDLANEFAWWNKTNGTSLKTRFSHYDHQTAKKLVRVIDIRTPDASAFIDTLASCKLVASASLHGMILAEAYNITWSWVRLRRKGEGSFKYSDFFLSVGVDPGDTTSLEVRADTPLDEIVAHTLKPKRRSPSLYNPLKLLDACPFCDVKIVRRIKAAI